MTKKLYTGEYKPHPSVSYGNISEEEKSSPMYKHIKELTEPIFNKALKETKKNHVSVGGVGSKNYEYAYYNPHNARFYFPYIKNRPITRGRLLSLKVVNSVERCLEDFMGCRIVVKKEFVEVTNKVDKERRFKIEGSAQDRYDAVVEAVAVLERECVVALKEFVNEFVVDGEIDVSFVAEKHWIPDNKALHSLIVDSVPLKMTFRNEVVKKVYNTEPRNVEFSDPVFAANAFRNMGLYDYAPAIAKELEDLRVEFMKSRPLVSDLESLKFDIVCFPDDVFKYRGRVVALSDGDKLELSDWTFSTFGGL